MHRSLLGLGSAIVLSLPSGALAQSSDAEPQSSKLADLSQKLEDPAFQQQMAVLAQSLAHVLLETPVGPLSEALNDATGSKIEPADPRATLGDMVPEAERIPEELGENLPRAMEAMSAMSGAIEAMMPALREMAAHLEPSLPPAATE